MGDQVVEVVETHVQKISIIEIQALFERLEGVLDALDGGIPPEEGFLQGLVDAALEEVGNAAGMMDAVLAAARELADQRDEYVKLWAAAQGRLDSGVEGVQAEQRVILEEIFDSLRETDADPEYLEKFFDTMRGMQHEVALRLLARIDAGNFEDE